MRRVLITTDLTSWPPVLRFRDPIVFRLSDYDEVVPAVILLIPIKVMNHFTRIKVTAHLLTSYYSVFVFPYIRISDLNLHVTVPDNSLGPNWKVFRVSLPFQAFSRIWAGFTKVFHLVPGPLCYSFSYGLSLSLNRLGAAFVARFKSPLVSSHVTIITP